MKLKEEGNQYEEVEYFEEVMTNFKEFIAYKEKELKK